jgi:tetratricopeptide (TPR) repeat protein
MSRFMPGVVAIAWLFAAGTPAAAVGVEDQVAAIAHQWDVVQYKTPSADQEDGFARLAELAHEVSVGNPGRAEPLVWEAIILSSEAGAKGGLGALRLVKQARSLLEAAEGIDPRVLDGSVYTTLGSLYYQVPGWPVGFGDKKKARRYLEKAIALDPQGLDANYFYGDFLYHQGEYRAAADALERALKAAPRPGREIADQGRRDEVRHLLLQARDKAGTS